MEWNDTINIRPAAAPDIPRLFELWQELMALRQQSDSCFRLLPDAQDRWSAAVTAWLANPECAVLVAEEDLGLVGYVVALLQESPVGLAPLRHGLITDLAVDVHRYHGGLGRALLDAARDWFDAQGISHILVYVSHQHAVEQAFWRAVGAGPYVDLMWMKV